MKIKYQNITQRLDIITRHLTETRKIILLNFVVMFLASSIILPASSTFAESFQSNGQVEFNLNPSISLSISGDLTIENLSPGDGKDSNIITVTATSNAIAGYNVSSTVGNNTHNYTTLNHSSNSNTFTNLSSNISSLTSFNDNTWGYSWCNGTCTSSSTWVSGAKGSTASGYNGLPLCNQATVSDCSGVTLIDETTNGSKTISFKIGAKASNTQASGTYQNVINFVSVANPNPEPQGYIMQDVATWGSSLSIGDEVTATDSRDGKEYYVAKLADGNIWMTQNLDHDIDSSYNYNFTNTDVSDTPVLASTYRTGDDTWEWSNTTPESYDPGNICWDGVVTTDPSGNFDNNAVACTDENEHYKIGNYYNWPAAVAMEDTSSYVDDGMDADQSICPAGWRLPTISGNKSFSNLINAVSLIGGVNGNVQSAPAYFVYGGIWQAQISSVGFDGFYWTSIASDMLNGLYGAHVFYFNVYSSGSEMLSEDNSWDGLLIRCVAR